MKPALLAYSRRLITSTAALVTALSSRGHAGVIEFYPAVGTVRIDGQAVTSIHGVPVTYAGIEASEPVGRFLIRGDLKLLSGAAGANGTTDIILSLDSPGSAGSPGLRLIVGNDFIAEPGTQVQCHADVSTTFAPSGGGLALQTPAGPVETAGGPGLGERFNGRNGLAGVDGWAANFTQEWFPGLQAYAPVVPGGRGGGYPDSFSRGGTGSRGAGPGSTDSFLSGVTLRGEWPAEKMNGRNGAAAAGTSATATQSGINNISPLTPGGDAGTAGTPGTGGEAGVRGTGGDGAGATVFNNDGGDGTGGGHGGNGTPGQIGGPGGHGQGGTHQTSQPELLIGGNAGGPGGSGGAGGGGGSGAPGCGGGGGGGGAYGFPGIPHDNGCGSGGGGGEGGGSGSGGRGGRGGHAGTGGRGGGAICITAYGKIRAWADFTVSGGNGGFGTPGGGGEPGGAGFLGGFGAPGGLGTDTGTGDGGRGGDAGNGGSGGNGGYGGTGGRGGGGAGGTLMLVATAIDCSQGTIDTRGGLSPAGDLYNGQDGRFVSAQLTPGLPQWLTVTAASGAQLRRADLPSLVTTTANVFNGMFATPRIALTRGTMTGGASPYGIVPAEVITDPSIAAAISAAPPGARSFLMRHPGAPAGLAGPFENYEHLVLVNFSTQPLTIPKLGLRGLQGFRMQPLKELGFARETTFGGDGQPVDIATLDAGQVYAVLVSKLGETWDIGFGYDGKTWRNNSRSGIPLYDVDGPNLLSAESLGYVPSIATGRCAPVSNGWSANVQLFTGELLMQSGSQSIPVVRPQGVDLRINAFHYNSAFQRLAGASISGNVSQAMYWDSKDHYANVQPGTLSGLAVTGSEILAMDAGLISSTLAGYAITTSGERAVRWNFSIFGSGTTDLHAQLPGGLYSSSRAVAISPGGEAAAGSAIQGATGFPQGVVWFSSGAAVPLPQGGAVTSRATGVAQGRICGFTASDGQTRKACVWNYAGTELTSIHPDEFVNSEATACNQDFIVGRGLDNVGYEHALIWTAPDKNAVLDLTDLVVDWKGAPVPTAIDASHNITVCTGPNIYNVTWWLIAPRLDTFQVIRVFRPDSAAATISWASQAGVSYQLWQNLNLTAGPWTKLGSALTATGPLTIGWDLDASAKTKFYRVEQLAP